MKTRIQALALAVVMMIVMGAMLPKNLSAQTGEIELVKLSELAVKGAEDIEVYKDRAFVAGNEFTLMGETGWGGVAFVDVSDPTAPVWNESFVTYQVNDVAVTTEGVMLTATSGGGVIVDDLAITETVHTVFGGRNVSLLAIGPDGSFAFAEGNNWSMVTRRQGKLQVVMTGGAGTNPNQPISAMGFVGQDLLVGHGDVLTSFRVFPPFVLGEESCQERQEFDGFSYGMVNSVVPTLGEGAMLSVGRYLIASIPRGLPPVCRIGASGRQMRSEIISISYADRHTLVADDKGFQVWEVGMDGTELTHHALPVVDMAMPDIREVLVHDNVLYVVTKEGLVMFDWPFTTHRVFLPVTNPQPACPGMWDSETGVCIR